MLPSISSTQFLLFYLILLFVPSRTVAYRWQICSTSDGHFTDNSTYEANLNLLLSSLVSNGSGSGFSTGTVGRVPNQVQGLVLCRGDTNATTCGSCLSNGAVEIRQICAYDRDAVVWYDECLLRFSNLQFLSTSDNDPTAALENVNQVNDDPDRFNKVVTELLDSTADWAAYNSTKRYATGQAFNVTPAFPTIYALAQCTPDMSASDCRNCLEGVSQGLPMARMGARNQGVRCNLRYESSLFFQGNPIIRLISPVTNATTPAENATTPASAPTSHPAVGPIGKEDQTDSEQATQVIESLLFRLATLRVATVNFAEANKLGEDAVRGKQLTWGIRYKIICGIARGLLYLHEESQLKIIHRDLKASNILLDADMNPKISDFGLAKLFDIDQTQGTTNRVMGTFGYMAPEYVMRGKFSIKSDVFSFGVLVLEILTGRKSNGSYNPEVTEVLLSYTPTMVPSMSSTPSLLFYLITLLLLSSPAVATQVCSTSAGKFTTNSTYESNLNLLLSSLISNGSASGFFTDTVGRMPNQVHGLVLCRGDTNATTCSSCLVTAGVEILQLCAYDKDAVVWYDDCHLRYSNLQFLSTLDNDPEMAVASEYQVYDETDRFNKVVNELMNRTADWAAYNSTKRYATGLAINATHAFPNIYGLAQCTPDMSATDCRQCLEGASQGLPMGRLIAKNLGVRCNLRCKVGPFFEGKPIIRLISALTNQTTPAENTTTPASAPASQPTVGSTSKEGKKKTIVAISISAVSAVLLIPIIYICYRRLRKQTSKSPYGSESEQAAQAESLLFQISALRIATANFSEENKLGEGGFGAVYKGVLPDGREIAVKRLLNSGHGLGELKNELVLVAKLRHRNLVKLLGVCLEEEKMIVYEYVPNTSLDNFLFEYVMHGKYSIKSDVFGFGVLVLEILTGRKSSGSYNPEVIEVLLSYAWEKWREGSALEIVDPTLGAHYQRSDLLRYMHIGLLCVQEKPNDRPTMSIVVVMLNSETLSLRAPSRPGFYLGNGGRNTNFDPSNSNHPIGISDRGNKSLSAVLLLSIIYACSMRLRKQILKPPYATDSEQATQVESLLFDLSTLRVATVNFSEENKLGEGGFGAVYKGVLPDGRVIAVKRLLNSGQGLGELKNELALVAKLQHRNLVKLLGVCLEEEKMIVYEYVPNTSLDKFLFDPVRGEQLTWGIRYKIICGIARGLLYLHEESQLKIIHRDLKACNILLDADMNPKISDFGHGRNGEED
ncbi:Cysteine-rich receptor-like protein kinase [Musa troglodytarum]|uniref:non-specific serine/threonine protein kinase n=1 Tax=Musa troglodytarum TaxID=320322 RepID=A0A9E7KS85_9LILI|nr:Cysteine-rich receptor-like protein kinase [Musa troglodytarum]